jgi:hypothetical protein
LPYVENSVVLRTQAMNVHPWRYQANRSNIWRCIE